MKIQARSCCSSTYEAPVRRLSIGILLAGAVLLVVGIVVTRRDSMRVIPRVSASIVVEERSPRSVVSRRAGTYTVQASDMRDEISLLVTKGDGVAISLDRLDVHAVYATRGSEQKPIALEPMNKDHLMAAVDPSRAGTLVVSLAIEGARHEVTFELPFGSGRRVKWDS